LKCASAIEKALAMPRRWLLTIYPPFTGCERGRGLTAPLRCAHHRPRKQAMPPSIIVHVHGAGRGCRPLGASHHGARE